MKMQAAFSGEKRIRDRGPSPYKIYLKIIEALRLFVHKAGIYQA